MASNTKIATCNYCGTRAALVLTGKKRHELACSSCGAPLHDLKALKVDAKPVRSRGRKPVEAPEYGISHREPPKKMKAKKKSSKRRRKGFFKEFFEDAFDLVEDIFD